MFRHVVMFKWADHVDDDHVAAVSAALDGLVDVIPQIVNYTHGADAGVNEGNYDYTVVGDFASADDYVIYRDDETHQEMIRTLIVGHISDRASVQFHTGD